MTTEHVHDFNGGPGSDQCPCGMFLDRVFNRPAPRTEWEVSVALIRPNGERITATSRIVRGGADTMTPAPIEEVTREAAALARVVLSE